MFSVGWGELFLLLVIGIIVVGPKQLPEVARNIVKFLKELNKIKEEWNDTLRNDESLQELQKSINEFKDEVKEPARSVHSTVKESVEDVKNKAKRLEEEIDRVVKEKEAAAQATNENLNEKTEVYDKGQSPDEDTK